MVGVVYQRHQCGGFEMIRRFIYKLKIRYWYLGLWGVFKFWKKPVIVVHSNAGEFLDQWEKVMEEVKCDWKYIPTLEWDENESQ